MDLKSVARGGFNTGRLYARDGQKIFWWQFNDKSVYFRDVSRMVDGYIDPIGYWLDEIDDAAIAHVLMHRYDNGLHKRWRDDGAEPHKILEVPDDFDFGAAMRI